MKENFDLDLFDLLKTILKKWKIIALIMMICAFLMNGVGVIRTIIVSKSNSDLQSTSEKQNELDNSFENILDAKEKADVELGVQMYFRTMESYDDINNYYTNSILMNLDANSVNTIELQYYVDTHFTVEYPVINKSDYTLSIVDAYISLVYSMDMSLDEELKKNINTFDVAYVKELVEIYSSDSGNFVVKIRGNSKNECDAIASVVSNYIESLYDDIKSIYGDYDLSFVSKKFYIDVDLDLLKEQQSQVATMATLKNTSNNIILNYSEQQKQYYYELINKKYNDIGELHLQELDEVIGDIESETTVADKEEQTIDYIQFKKMILGALIGLFVMCSIISLQYMCSDTVKTKDEFEKIYNLRVLDSIIEKNKKRNNDTSEEKDISVLCATISALAYKYEYSNIYISSSCDSELPDEIILRIQKELHDKNIDSRIRVTNKINSKDVENISSCDVVLLVEYLKHTMRKDLKKYIELCNVFEQKIMGVVCIE